jgi:serine/threonine protein kinase
MHRDIKPPNILIKRQPLAAVLGDFWFRQSLFARAAHDAEDVHLVVQSARDLGKSRSVRLVKRCVVIGDIIRRDRIGASSVSTFFGDGNVATHYAHMWR